MKRLPGKIILVDQHAYEKILLQQALATKQWISVIEYFPSAEEAIAYLKETQDTIFLIISDIFLSTMSGLSFKKILDRDDKLKVRQCPLFLRASRLPKNKYQKRITIAYKAISKNPTRL